MLSVRAPSGSPQLCLQGTQSTGSLSPITQTAIIACPCVSLSFGRSMRRHLSTGHATPWHASRVVEHTLSWLQRKAKDSGNMLKPKVIPLHLLAYQ